MATFTPRIEEEIIPDMASSVVSKTPLTDLVAGSVILSILETAAAEDAEQYVQMFEIIRNFSLDTTTGSDLDDRASEYNLERLEAQKASGTVTISDTSITKVSIGISNSFPGPVIGQTFVYADKTTDFSASGNIIVGRNTTNVETVAYSSIDNTSPFYTKFNLSTPFTKNHGIDEEIVFSQGGNRIISSGTVVRIPSSDVSDEIEFVTTEIATILDGEEEIEGVPVEAVEAGSDGNAPANSIKEFDSLPFSTAEVNNDSTFTNGRDEETDQELRDRIKQTIQSLSKGTKDSIELAAIGTEYEDQRVISANLVEATIAGGISKLYIDDGSGFIATENGQGLENVVIAATGGEKFLKLDNFPLKQEIYISNRNNNLDFDEGSGTVSISITEGVYEIDDLLTSIASLMTSAGTQTYTLELDSFEKVKISAPSAFDLEWKTGPSGLDNGLRNVGETLGFNISGDNENFNEYTATDLPRICLLIKNKENLSGSVTLTNGSAATSGIAVGEVAVGDFIKMVADGSDAWARVESIGPVVLSWTYEGAGGTGTAERMTILFPKDYTLNRFTGSFELEDELVSGDKIEAGETSLRATVESGNAETYSLSPAASLTNVATFTQGSNIVTGTALDSDVEVGDYVKVDADAGGALTGTLTFTNGSTAVSAVGGAFTTELEPGDFIKLDSDNNTKFARVNSVTDNNNLVLVDGYTGTSGSGSASKADPWALVTVVTATQLTLAWNYAGAGGVGVAGSVSNPDELVVLVNDLNSQTVTFVPFDFSTLGAGTAIEVRDRIDIDLTGASSILSPQTGADKVKIISDEYGSDGKITVTGGSANTALAFSLTQMLGIDGYKYFTELLQEVQHVIDGNESKEYEQVRAAGVQIAVLAPDVLQQTIALSVEPVEGLTLDVIESDIKAAVSNYINSLGVGDDVILSEITAAIQEIVGVFDVQIDSPSTNVPVGDNELARVKDENITVGE